jgi:cysteine desulfurase/selenocysteine lyase
MLSKESRLLDFPSLANRVYLNTAAEGIPPKSVLSALNQYGQDKLLGMDGRLLHQEQWSQTKSKVAQLLNQNSDDIGICSCSSEAYNLAYLALRLKDGDEIIINDLDFPAGATPWMTSTSPAVVKVWRSKNGELDTSDLVKLLSPRTRLVNTSLISFYNGFRIDVDEISQVVRRNSGAMLAVDVTQGFARVPFDVKNADLVISSTHKWLLASHGGGLVGVSPERADEWNVPAGGWFNIENAFDDSRFDSLVNKKGAASFMVGMPNYPAIYAINAALDYILKIGVKEIDDHTKDLMVMCRAGIADLPVELLGSANPTLPSGIIAFKHPKFEEINNELHAAGIHVMSQAGRVRVSIHGYNNEEDVESFLEVLKKALSAHAR